jgi:8-oxo-dGTP pyrophosphatase MutT (NUDIX family)
LRPQHKAYIGAIVSASDGRVLCQLRDDVPGIICPGTWCCCSGGHLERGESPETGVLRELREEFEIEVGNLRPLLKHVEGAGEYEGTYYSYTADLLTAVEEVKCNEGVRVEFFRPEEAVDFPQHPVSRLFLRSYMNLATKLQS